MPDNKLEPQASVGLNVENNDTNPDGDVSRKSFIGWMAIGWTAFSLATGGFLTMIVFISFFIFITHKC